ncbi:MAG: DUF1361 domain-containing protein [Candidatus Izemoplasmatales bacterium]
MSKKQLMFHGIIYLVFLIISVLVFLVVEEGIHLMLGWNAFLAFIPISLVYAFDNKQNQKNMNVLIFLLWIFFFPNSIYLVTDLIYINKDAFIEEVSYLESLIYLRDFSSYLGFFHLLIACLYGILTSLISFKYFSNFINEKLPKYHLPFFIILPVLVSIGIYLGRFLRFNTWDIFNFLELIKEVYRSLDWFAVSFILIFSLLQYLIYGFYLLFQRKII